MNLKKILTTAVAIATGAAMLAGCESSSTATSSASSAASSAEASTSSSSETGSATTTTDGDIKIGCIFYSNTDALGSQTYELVNAAASTLGVETVWEVGNYDNDSQLNALRNLIAADIDGVIFQPMDYDFLPKVIDVCEEAGVYLGVMFAPIQNQETIDYLAESEYFVGYSYEDEKENAKNLVKVLGESDRKNIGVGYATPGNVLADQANEGFDEQMEEEDMTVLAEYSNPIDSNVNTVSSNVQNFLSAYPEMDGMVFGGMSGGAGEAILQLVTNSNRDIKIVGRDIFAGMESGFEAGSLAAVSGATAPDGLYMFACVYNAIKGTPVTDTYVKLVQPTLVITSVEECNVYDTYIADTDKLTTELFNDEYFKQLDKANNADLSQESIQEMMDTWTMDWVSEHAGA